MVITNLYEWSAWIQVEVECHGQRVMTSWSTEEGWLVDDMVEEFGWTDDQYDQFWEKLRELPTPRLTFEEQE